MDGLLRQPARFGMGILNALLALVLAEALLLHELYRLALRKLHCVLSRLDTRLEQWQIQISCRMRD